MDAEVKGVALKFASERRPNDHVTFTSPTSEHPFVRIDMREGPRFTKIDIRPADLHHLLAFLKEIPSR